MTTEKQKKAVKFCEEMLEIDFIGDINLFEDVSKYLSTYLNSAKKVAEYMSSCNKWAIEHGYI